MQGTRMATTHAAALPVIALLLPIAWLACWIAAHQHGVVVMPDGVLASTSSWPHGAAPALTADAAPSSTFQPGGIGSRMLSLLDLHSVYWLLLALLLADLWRHASAQAGGRAAAGSSASSSATQQQQQQHQQRRGRVDSAAALLAVAKLMPLACGLLSVLATPSGLLTTRHEPLRQLLQLLQHPWTPLLMASMTLVSQAHALYKASVCILHFIMAAALGVLTSTALAGASAHPARSAGRLSHAQSMSALLLLDVVVPCALAYRSHQRERRQAITTAHTSLTAAASPANQPPAAQGSTTAATPAEDSPAQPAERSNSRDGDHPASLAPPSSASAAALQQSPTRQRHAANGMPAACSPGPAAVAASERTAHAALAALDCNDPGSIAAAAAAVEASVMCRLEQSHEAGPSTSDALQQRAAAGTLGLEDALAACARGVAARRAHGLTPATALYRSSLHHHTVSFKAPLGAASDVQGLVQSVLTHLQLAGASPVLASSSAAAVVYDAAPWTPPASTASAPATCAGNAAEAALCSPAAAPQQSFAASRSRAASAPSAMLLPPVATHGCLHLLLPVALSGSHQEAAVASLLQAQAAQRSSAGAAQDASGSSPQPGGVSVSVQIDQREPQTIFLGCNSMWEMPRGATAASDAGSTSSASDAASCCWLEPHCVLLDRGSSSGQAAVAVWGIPAAAGSRVRLLIVQGSRVAADTELAVLEEGQSLGAGSSKSVRCTRLALQDCDIQPGPALVVVLPPSTPSAAGAAARVWACLPMWAAGSSDAASELQQLFNDMCAQLEGSGEAGTSPAALRVHQRHWQPLLWDALYASSGTGVGCIAGISALAGSLHAFSPAGEAGQHTPAVVWRNGSTADSSSSDSMGEQLLASRQQALGSVLELLASRGRWASIQQLLTAVGVAAAAVPAGAPAAAANSPTAAAGDQDSKPGSSGDTPAAFSALPPVSPTSGHSIASRHDSFDSYNHFESRQLLGAVQHSSWRPPMQLMQPEGIALQQEQREQEQQDKYVHTLTPERSELPSAQQEGWEKQVAGQLAALQPQLQPRQAAGSQRRLSLDSYAGVNAGMLPSLSGTPLPAASLDGLPLRLSLDAKSTALRQQYHHHRLLQQQLMPLQEQPPYCSPGGGSQLASPAAAAAVDSSPSAASVVAAAAAAAAVQPVLLPVVSGHDGSSFSSPASYVAAEPPPGWTPRAVPLHMQSSLATASPSFPSPATSVHEAAAAGAGAASTRGGSLHHPHQQRMSLMSPPGRIAAPAAGPPGSADSGSAPGGRMWAVFDTTGVEGFDAGLDTNAANALISTGTAGGITGRGNTANSTTWFAIPTSQSGLGLPPVATPHQSRLSATVYSSSTGKLRRPHDSHAHAHAGLTSGSLTPLPAPRSHSVSYEQHDIAAAASSSSASTGLSVPGSGPSPPSRHGPRTMLFSPVRPGKHSRTIRADGSSSMGLSRAGHAAAHQEGAVLQQPGGGVTPFGGGGEAGAGFAWASGTAAPPPGSALYGSYGGAHVHHALHGLRRPSAASSGSRFGPGSPQVTGIRGGGGVWTPGAPHMSPLATIRSDDSFEQNVQLYLQSPSPAGAAALLKAVTPRRPAGSVVPGSGYGAQGSATPVPPLPTLDQLTMPHGGPAAVAVLSGSMWDAGGMATPRSVLQPPAAMAGTPAAGLPQLRTTPRHGGVGRVDSSAAGSYGDTVSGVLQLLGGTPGGRLQNSVSAALSSSSSGSWPTDEARHAVLSHSHVERSGYLTPLRLRPTAGARLPASARPASRVAAFGTPGAARGLRRAVPGSAVAPGPLSTAGLHEAPGSVLDWAGRSIAGVAPSPAPLRWQQQQQTSTIAHIQSLLPAPGSASKRRAAQVAATQATAPADSAGMLPHMLQSPPLGMPIHTPLAGSPRSSSSSAILGGGDVAVGTPPDAPIIPVLSAASVRRVQHGRGSLIHPWQQQQHHHQLSGSSHAHDSGAACSPPPAPMRPMPGVLLVPAEEAGLLFASDEGDGGFSSDDEAFGEQQYSGQQHYGGAAAGRAVRE